MRVYYRGQHCYLTSIGFIGKDKDGRVSCYINIWYEGIEEIKEKICKKVSGVYRK